MDAERVEDVTDWDGQPFDDGFAGLRALADRGFSGAIDGNGGRLFMLNGRVVAVADGDLDDFADASGTAHEAPHPSLALLYAMRAQGGELKTKYYTEDTPISGADRTLRSGGFTGYLRLSEDVLSGDYYLTYYGGESMSVAFVGSARRLKTGDEAFELADDEVGIYGVYEVDLDVRDVPGAAEHPDAAGGTAADAGATTADAPGAGGGSDAAEPTGPADPAGGVSIGGDDPTAGIDPSPDTDPDPGPDPNPEPDPDPATTDGAVPSEIDIDLSPGSDSDSDSDPDLDPGAEAGPDAGVGTAPDAGPETDSDPAVDPAAPDPDVDPEPDPELDSNSAPDSGPNPEPTPSSGPASGNATPTSPDAADPDAQPEPTPDHGDGAAGAGGPAGAAGPAGAGDPGATGDHGGSAGPGGSAPADPGDAAGGGPDEFSREAEWRESATIPALDPAESGTDPGEGPSAGGDAAAAGPDPAPDSGPDPASGSGSPPERGSAAEARSASGSASGSAADREDARESAAERPAVQRNELQRRVARLEEALSETEERREALAAERDELAAERDRARERADELESRVGELEAEVERLEGRLREARARLPDGEQSLSPAEALSGTNLFVRYDSQGGATLERAHDGAVDRQAVDENLRLEHHTAFDESEVTVDGRPYREFLHDSIQYGFAEWVVTELLYEIRATGNRSALRDLYDAIPAIDRAEIDGEISVRRREAGEEHREQRAFDLVLRDRMGNPLFVADLNDSRDPTAQGSLESLVGDGRDVAETSDSFAGAFAVTASYFEPGALEAAADATGGGLLSRGTKKSYVKLSRKRGFHLCLVEAREGEFHLNVPEL